MQWPDSPTNAPYIKQQSRRPIAAISLLSARRQHGRTSVPPTSGGPRPSPIQCPFSLWFIPLKWTSVSVQPAQSPGTCRFISPGSGELSISLRPRPKSVTLLIPLSQNDLIQCHRDRLLHWAYTSSLCFWLTEFQGVPKGRAGVGPCFDRRLVLSIPLLALFISRPGQRSFWAGRRKVAIFRVSACRV